MDSSTKKFERCLKIKTACFGSEPSPEFHNFKLGNSPGSRRRGGRQIRSRAHFVRIKKERFGWRQPPASSRRLTRTKPPDNFQKRSDPRYAADFRAEINSEGTPYDLVTAIFQAREGNIWIGSKDGLSQIKARRCTAYTKDTGRSHNRVI